MQIIRSNKECKWVRECDCCGCVFIYKGDEITYNMTEDLEAAYLQRMRANETGEQPEPPMRKTAMVQCPECQEMQKIPLMACNRRAVRGSMDDEWEDVYE